MGMSASQIRYCMLLARKTDIEYQGQQINQQRTTLATQSSAYNAQMLTLTVPTPPSTEEYTINTYEFTYNGQECTIKGANYISREFDIDITVGEGDQKTTITKKVPKNTYIVDYVTRESQDVASRGVKYSVRKIETPATDETTEPTVTYKVIVGNNIHTLQKVGEETDPDDKGKDVTDIKMINESNIKKIKKRFNGEKNLLDDATFYYVEISQGNYAYFTLTDLENNYAQSYVVSQQSVDVQKKMYGAIVNWTDTGRMLSIEDEDGHVYSLDVSTEADDAAYQNAYNEYLYQKDQYNKTIDDINAKLEVIQSQDKKLELQLTNLDTQEKAIKTEMDSVKQVISQNIEKSFQVFT